MHIRELQNLRGESYVFIFERHPDDYMQDSLYISLFNHYDRISLLTLKLPDTVSKIFLFDMNNFDYNLSSYDNDWEFEAILNIHKYLIESEFDDVAKLKSLHVRKVRYKKFFMKIYLELTNATDEQLACILLKWNGLLYDRTKNRSI